MPANDPQTFGDTLAAVNAGLNSLSAVFLLAGYGFAKAHKPAAQKVHVCRARSFPSGRFGLLPNTFYLTGRIATAATV